MITQNEIFSFIKRNGWILIISIIFIAWKFFLIYTQFKVGLGNILFDDASVYIYHIESIRSCHAVVFCKEFAHSFLGYFGFEHLSYRLFFGSIAQLLKIDSTQAFFLSFYMGILILLSVLIFFLKNINPNKKLIAFSLLFLALYSGAGSYHGFFWVVPSFFALLLFLLIFSIILGNCKNWKIYLSILIPALICTHLIGIYFIVIFPTFLVIYSFFTKKIDRLLVKKVLFSIFIAFIFYVSMAGYLRYHGGNPYGVESLIRDSGRSIILNSGERISKTDAIQSQGKLFPGFGHISTDYLDWVFPHPLAIVPFFLSILLLFYYKQYKLLSIYFSALIFTLASSINIFAVRSLLLLWPITYVFYAFGAWFSFEFINDKIKNKNLGIFLKTLIISAIIIFIGINVAYSYLSAREIPISFKKIIKEL